MKPLRHRACAGLEARLAVRHAPWDAVRAMAARGRRATPVGRGDARMLRAAACEVGAAVARR